MARSVAPQGKTRVTARELPAPGYPVSEELIANWFRDRYNRAATEQELGAIMGAMVRREATPLRRGPNVIPQGWVIGPAAPPTRR